MILFIVSHIQVKYIWTTPHLIFKIFILCFVYTTSATTFLKKCLKTSFYQNIFMKFQQNKSSLSPSPPNWNGNHVIRYKGVCINFSDLLMSKITSHQYIIMPSNISILLQILHLHTFALIFGYVLSDFLFFQFTPDYLIPCFPRSSSGANITNLKSLTLTRTSTLFHSFHIPKHCNPTLSFRSRNNSQYQL